MGRKEAREIALHLIFELSFKQFDDAELVSARLEQEVMESLAMLRCTEVSCRKSRKPIFATPFSASVHTTQSLTPW